MLFQGQQPVCSPPDEPLRQSSHSPLWLSSKVAPLLRCHVVEETEQRVLLSLSALEMVAAAQQCLLTDCHHCMNVMNYQEEAACVLIGAVVVRA